MSLSPNLHWFAAMALERLLYCLAGGMALGIVMWLVLRLLPGRNSRTRFVVWFSTLVAVAIMPLAALAPSLPSTLPNPGAPSHALIAIPASWAEYIVLTWSALALIGVARVLAGVWQLRRMRKACVPLDMNLLSAASQARIAELGKRRMVSVLVSSEVEVPTAIGFVHPAIVVPVWLAEETASTELEYVLLHELAHLERWDDWSNLVQKLIKSVLFFHPAVWWIERKLSLDREMACDDAVLAQSPNPRLYAECLARVAEKRFLRRQIALAQAAVDRVKQLSFRVARILISDGRNSTRLWKPAVPMVLGVAAICAVSTFKTTELVRFTEPAPAASSAQIPLAKTGDIDPVVNVMKSPDTNSAPARATQPTDAKAWPASLDLSRRKTQFFPAKHRAKHSKPAPLRSENAAPAQIPSEAAALFMVTSFDQPAVENERVPAGALLVLTTTRKIVPTSSGFVQFSTWELRLIVPADRPVKTVPRKT